jgi:hypothetical protein
MPSRDERKVDAQFFQRGQRVDLQDSSESCFISTETLVPTSPKGNIRLQYVSRCGVPMLTEGVWAEVKVDGEHLRLFSEHNAQGVQASVYNVNAKAWIAPSESVDDIEQGKDRAAEHARAYLKRTANLALPPLNWKKSRSR